MASTRLTRRSSRGRGSSPRRRDGRGPVSSHTLSVAERLARVNSQTQELVRPVVENPREYVLLSVRGIAKRLSIDPTKMARIVRGMGFAGYPSFQQFLRDLSIANATSLEILQQSSTNGTDLPHLAKNCLDQNASNLQALRYALSYDRVLTVAKRICTARRILLLGGDLASALVSFLEYQMMVLGLPVIAARSAGHVVHLVRTTTSKDTIIAISFRKGLRQTVEGLKEARAKGAYCVGITDTYVSPIASLSDDCFMASVQTTSFGASYVAPMALLDVLLMACAHVDRKRTIQLLQLAEEEQRTGKRFFNP